MQTPDYPRRFGAGGFCQGLGGITMFSQYPDPDGLFQFYTFLPGQNCPHVK